MDHTEDLSARVLLKHILTTEPPRTPITRSASAAEVSTSGTRRSSRLGNKDAGAQTPQNILRRSLKHKMRESITRKSLPAPKRRTASVVLRRIETPAPASMLFDDGDTPRHILRNILLTEPARSPVVHEKAGSEEPQPFSANSSIASKRPSIELSGFDLPDLTISNAVSTAKGLSRKRPRRSLNVTAFEKRLADGDDVEEQNEESIRDQSSLSLSSSSSLSLKTPFADVRTEKRGLQRRVPNRRKISEEEFGAAVNKRHMGGVSSFVLERGHNETAFSEGFTLGLSKLSEPDITADIVHCDTALYPQPDAMTSNISIVATQDKPTVMASQLQRQISEMEQSELGEEKSMYAFPTEEEAVAEPRDSQTADGQHEGAVATSKSEEEEGTAESQTSVGGESAESEKEENKVEAQTEEEAAADSQTEEEEDPGEVDSKCVESVATSFQSEEEEVPPESEIQEEEEEAADPQTEEDAVDSLPEEEEEAPDSQTREEEDEEAADSQTEEEEEAADSQTEEDVIDSVPEEEVEDEEEVADDESDQEDPAEVGLSDSKPEVEHDGEPQEEDNDEQASGQLEGDLEHISRRAPRSEGGLVVPVIEAQGDLSSSGCSDRKSKTHATFDLHNSLEVESHESGPLPAGPPDSAESSIRERTDDSLEAELDDDKENSFHLPEVADDTEEDGHLNDEQPEEEAAAAQEEEWEDEEDDDEEIEVPSKTPAFVREKRNLFRPDPPASPSVFKNIQASSTSDGEGLPASKPKQVRKKRAGPTRKQGSLPKSYLMGVFKHFAKTKVSADVYPVLQEIMDKFFERVAEDLETFAVHAKRKTIDVEDAELLLRRQGHVSDKVPVEVLIEKYLRMDQRRLLIPIATSGNVVVPKKRR
uniref:enolase-phosphatase E1 n=1 Tax=Semicossyphus pulcher TaxID=241346 RepID=UPI0037E8546C